MLDEMVFSQDTMWMGHAEKAPPPEHLALGNLVLQMEYSNPPVR